MANFNSHPPFGFPDTSGTPRRRGRPRKLSFERRQQFTVSLTAREHFIIEQIDEEVSHQQRRRIYKGELPAMMAFRQYGELYTKFSKDYDAEISGAKPQPLTEEEVAAEAEQTEADRQKY